MVSHSLREVSVAFLCVVLRVTNSSPTLRGRTKTKTRGKMSRVNEREGRGESRIQVPDTD